MLGAHCRIETRLDLADACGFENKDIARLGLGEVVADLIHKHLVAGIHVASGNDFAGGVFATWQHTEVAHKRVAGHEECVGVVAADDFREGEKIQISALVQRHDDIALLGA